LPLDKDLSWKSRCRAGNNFATRRTNWTEDRFPIAPRTPQRFRRSGSAVESALRSGIPGTRSRRTSVTHVLFSSREARSLPGSYHRERDRCLGLRRNYFEEHNTEAGKYPSAQAIVAYFTPTARLRPKTSHRKNTAGRAAVNFCWRIAIHPPRGSGVRSSNISRISQA
jgi:hypothetical protein